MTAGCVYTVETADIHIWGCGGGGGGGVDGGVGFDGGDGMCGCACACVYACDVSWNSKKATRKKSIVEIFVPV